MKKVTIRGAEIVTVIYALLVFTSLLIDSTYYSQFNIHIVSYMSVSEILLSCIGELPITPGLRITIFLVAFVIFFITMLFRRRCYLFNSNNSVWDKFRIVAIYNTIAILILPYVLFFTLYGSNQSIDFENILSLFYHSFPIEVLLLVLYIRVLPSYFYKIKAGEYYYSLLKFRFLYRNNYRTFSPTFTHREHKLIYLNYRYRILLVIIVFFVSLFIGQKTEMNLLANDVKKYGRGICVVMDGENLHVDTREGSVNYIGECTNYIFLYDKLTQGTMVYARKHIHNYLVITDYVAHTNIQYDKCAESLQEGGKHVFQDILNQIDTIPPLVDEFSITIPNSCRLIEQSNNHSVWKDTITNTYIEKVSLPKSLFDDAPYSGIIFNTSIYIYQKYASNNMLLCKTAICTYHGKGGEIVKTIIGEGEHYTAWIFYDSTGNNETLIDDIIGSIHLIGNVWQQMAIIFHANKVFWFIVLVIVLVFCLFGFVVLHEDYDMEHSWWYNIKEQHFVIFMAFFPFTLFYVILLDASNRLMVIITAVALYILIIFVLLNILTFILYLKALKQKRKPIKEK